jgi:hypothetical protein
MSSLLRDCADGLVVLIIIIIITYCVCWDRPFGIATSYGLDGPGIEFQWGARFSAPVQTDPGAHLAFRTMGTGGKAALAWL